MSTACAPPRQANLGDSPPVAEPSPTAVEFHYAQTDSFVALLHELNASLLVTTYQANKLLVVRAAGGGLSTLVRTFDQPMGLALAGRRLALGTATKSGSCTTRPTSRRGSNPPVCTTPAFCRDRAM